MALLCTGALCDEKACCHEIGRRRVRRNPPEEQMQTIYHVIMKQITHNRSVLLSQKYTYAKTLCKNIKANVCIHSLVSHCLSLDCLLKNLFKSDERILSANRIFLEIAQVVVSGYYCAESIGVVLLCHDPGLISRCDLERNVYGCVSSFVMLLRARDAVKIQLR